MGEGIKKKKRIISVLATANVPTLPLSVSMASELVQMLVIRTTRIRTDWTQVLPNGTAGVYGHIARFLFFFLSFSVSFLFLSSP